MAAQEPGRPKRKKETNRQPQNDKLARLQKNEPHDTGRTGAECGQQEVEVVGVSVERLPLRDDAGGHRRLGERRADVDGRPSDGRVAQGSAEEADVAQFVKVSSRFSCAGIPGRDVIGCRELLSAVTESV